MAEITVWFPVAIYHEDNLFSQEQNKLWSKKILDLSKDKNNSSSKWQGDTQTSHLIYELSTDPDFNLLFSTISDRVHQFAVAHNSYEQYSCGSSWFNINKKNTFQELHTHNGAIFSGVYYVKVPKNSGKILFDSPLNPDMLPVKNIVTRNELTFESCTYEVKESRLIIFRSYLRHLVEVNRNFSSRISISFNYK